MKNFTAFKTEHHFNVKRIRLPFLILFLIIVSFLSVHAQSLNVASNITVLETAGTAVFTVNLSSPASGTVTVNYATSNGGASNPSDYLSTSGTLTFLAGETLKTVSVVIVNDFLFESSESFSLSISNATGANINNPSRSCTITNDDPQFNIAASSSSINESAGTQTYTVTLTSPQAYNATVNYATSNINAVSGSDYVATSGTLSFAPGETTKVFTVAIINDYINEIGSENFRVTISNAQNSDVSMPMSINTANADVQILNDDPTFSLSAASSSILESAGTQSYTVTLSSPQVYNASVSYATSNLNANSGSDYIATSGTLTFAPGETIKVFTVTIINDFISEAGSENFRVTISSAQNSDVSMPMSINTANADVQILNDDPTFSISAASSTILESAGTQSFTVTLSSPQAYNASVNYATSNLNATSGIDYVATSGTLTFAPGETTKVFLVTIINDFISEGGSENFRVTLSSAQNSDVSMPMSINTSIADVQILNDDPTFSIFAASSSILEAAGTQSYTVTLSSPQAYNASVNYATSNLSAISGSDYVAASGTLIFAPGETTKVFTVTIINDFISEGGSENFRVTLSNAQNSDVSLPMSINTINADVQILNDDPTFSISAASSSILEAAGTQTYTITLSSPQTYNASVNYATSNLNAVSGLDYVATSGTLTFAPGETTKVLLVTIINDFISEGGSENFRVTLSDAQNSDVSMPMSINTSIADVQILNDDPTFSISAASSSILEAAGTQTYTVTLSSPQTYNASVNYATSNLNAVAGTDYVATSGTLAFAPGETTKVFTVTILNDFLSETGSENFRVTLSNAQNSDVSMPMSINNSNADVSITNDDPIISISNPSSVSEAFTYQNFTVTMTAPQSYPVSVEYIAQGSSAEIGTDFTFSSCILNLIFAPGETTKNISIRILDDAITEPNQTYLVIISNARNASVNMPMSIGTSTATATIIDNDGAGCGTNVLGVPVISGTTIYCPNTNLSLSVAPVSGAIGYSWKGPNAFSASGSSITINNVTAIHSGVYTVKAYRAGGTVCDSSVAVSVNVAVVPCASTVSLKLYIEGYYLDSGKMAAVLYNHGETDNATITDSVDINLHNDFPPYTLIATQKAGLFTNGTLLATFPSIIGSYYVSVKHSSAVQTWTANPLILGPNPAVYDFSNSASQAYGGNLVMVDPGVFALYNGDMNQDDNIDLLDASIMEEKISNFETCFLPTDLNGDGNTDLLDAPMLENNINLFVFSNHP